MPRHRSVYYAFLQLDKKGILRLKLKNRHIMHKYYMWVMMVYNMIYTVGLLDPKLIGLHVYDGLQYEFAADGPT